MLDSEYEKEHMFNQIKREYEERLDDEQLKSIKENLDAVISALEQIRKIQLDNRDEPFIIFKPLTGFQK